MFDLVLWLELRRWRRAGRTARLWWRDDDAMEASARLNHLLRLSLGVGVPLTLAVVPTGDMAGLSARLRGAPRVSVVQHGVDHQDRRGGPAAGEFPHDWSQREVEIALRRGWGLLQTVSGAHPIFVPPWNDAHPALEGALGRCGYAGWSACGTLGSGPLESSSLPRLDIHLDLLRWRNGARFRGRGRMLAALAGALRRRRRAGLWDAPIGILTHHLVHDPAAWVFLEAFLFWTRSRQEFVWVALPDLVREAAAAPATAARAGTPGRPGLSVVSAA